MEIDIDIQQYMLIQIQMYTNIEMYANRDVCQYTNIHQYIYQMNSIRGLKSVFGEMVRLARVTTAKSIRQMGLLMDRKGSFYAEDVAYLQPNSRHRTIVHLQYSIVSISPSCYISPNATCFGFVFIGPNSYLGFAATIDGVAAAVRIGSDTKIGDNTTVQSASFVPDLAFPRSTLIANRVNIEHNCTIFNAFIDDDVSVGFNTTVMEGAQLERGCIIASNSLVPAGARIPENTLWAGSPVKFVRELQPVNKRINAEEPERFKLTEI